LQEVDDAQRTSQKISFDYCGPDDFLKLKRTLEAMGIIKARLKEELKFIPNLSLEALVERLQPQNDLIQVITEAIDEDALVRDKEISIKSESIVINIDPEIEEGIDMTVMLSNNKNEEKKISIKSSTKTRRNSIKKDIKNSADINFEEVQALIKADNWIIKKR
jgi:DNA mismatch repair ATPase MutS